MILPKALICDIDGVLADHRHRLHWIDESYLSVNHQYPVLPRPFKRDYKAFYDAMDKDGVNEWCSELIMGMEQPFQCDIIFVTGRPERYREMTKSWIESNVHLRCGGKTGRERYYKLFMRPDFLPIHRKDWIDSETGEKKVSYPSLCDLKEDHRPSAEVKREIYEREIRDKYDVLFVLEDDSTCAEMYRELGLQVLKVM